MSYQWCALTLEVCILIPEVMYLPLEVVHILILEHTHDLNEVMHILIPWVKVIYTSTGSHSQGTVQVLTLEVMQAL